jgi:hypothetical protein
MPYKIIMNTLKLVFTIIVAVLGCIAYGESYKYSENTELSGAEPNVLIEADFIDGVPVIDPDSVAADKHWRATVSGGVLSVYRTYGTVFSIR